MQTGSGKSNNNSVILPHYYFTHHDILCLNILTVFQYLLACIIRPAVVLTWSATASLLGYNKRYWTLSPLACLKLIHFSWVMHANYYLWGTNKLLYSWISIDTALWYGIVKSIYIMKGRYESMRVIYCGPQFFFYQTLDTVADSLHRWSHTYVCRQQALLAVCDKSSACGLVCWRFHFWSAWYCSYPSRVDDVVLTVSLP